MQPQTAPEKSAPRYSVAEYMLLEENSAVRHEFFEGEVFAMSGGTLLHNLLVLNSAFALRTGLRGSGKKCRVVAENVQLAVEKGRHYNYPDVAVTCAAKDIEAERTITTPILLIEVLSKSTGNRDRGWKFKQYKQLPSLQHYILVSQTTCLVEWYRREESGVWSYTPLVLFADELFFPELDVTLRVQDIYEESGLAQMSIRPDADEL